MSDIFLTLKEIRGKDFNEAFDMIKEIFRCLFETHSYLLNSDKINEKQKLKIAKDVTKEFMVSSMHDIEYTQIKEELILEFKNGDHDTRWRDHYYKGATTERILESNYFKELLKQKLKECSSIRTEMIEEFLADREFISALTD